MGNPYRGDVALVVDGVELPMRLTLGALAALEAELVEDSLMALVERFETGAFRASDLICLLVAGLRGAGWQGSAVELSKAEIGGGAIEAAKSAARMLKLAFSAPQ